MIKPLTTKLVAIPLLLVAGSGAVFAQSASEERTVAPFSRLEVLNGVDVYLTQGDEQSLRVEVEGFDLEDIGTEVEGDTLTLSNEASRDVQFFADRRAVVYLDFVQLSAIEASSGSDIEGRNDLQVDELTVRASGGSDVELAVEAQSLEFMLSGGSDLEVSGETQSLSIEASGGSDVDARSLESERARVRVSGGSDASIRASAAVNIDAHGGSDVVVSGDPAERTVDNDRSSDVIWR
jgi:Putative auto-transporter adhesin, head GIN domain